MHPEIAGRLNQLADLYEEVGRYAEAEQIYRRSLAIRETVLGPADPGVSQSLNNLAELLRKLGRYSEAEPLYQRSLLIAEAALGPRHTEVGIRLGNIAGLFRAQGRHAEAEPLYKRSIEIAEETVGINHPRFAIRLNNLAELYRDQGRFAEAESLYRRAISVIETGSGSEHPTLGLFFNNLALLFSAQRRYGDAEALFKRSIFIAESSWGQDHPESSLRTFNLAGLYNEIGRYEEADPLFSRSIGSLERALGSSHPTIAMALNSWAANYQGLGRLDEAETLYKRSIRVHEINLGPDNPKLTGAANNLAELYRIQGRFQEARPLYQRSLAIIEKSYGADHPHAAITLGNLAWLSVAETKWGDAAKNWLASTAILQRRSAVQSESMPAEAVSNKQQGGKSDYQGLVKVTQRLANSGNQHDAAARDMFLIAQRGLSSEAADSLAKMAARSASGVPELASLVRERQDLVAEWGARDRLLIAARSNPSVVRNANEEGILRDRLSAIEDRVKEIDVGLGQKFPEYAALANPQPLSISEVQTYLGSDEALLLFYVTDNRFGTLPEETFVWIATRNEVRWLRSEFGASALAREVAALRCGLDRTSNWHWDDTTRRWLANNQVCKALAPEGLTENAPLPFDPARAHVLYEQLIIGAEELIAGKHLLVVPSGPLNALSFHVLVTSAPPTGTGTPSWLGTRQPITVLPAASSLRSLRAHAKPTTAREPFIAFANPLLTDADGKDRRAWGRQNCVSSSATDRVRVTLGSLQNKIAQLFRGGLANVEDVRRLAPLPETADEVCAVATMQGISQPNQVVHLGERASEKQVKTLSANGMLAKARIVHFATHGLVADEMASLAEKNAEPALVLTPPKAASKDDDGLLTASEIASLKLDAEWVVLSACNTAASDGVGGDALSGLARAFFYAGTRALLVSHWYVDSDATVALVTKTFDALKANPKIGRAEALKQAMTSLVTTGGRLAHPAAWAPFIVVGEGGAGL